MICMDWERSFVSEEIQLAFASMNIIHVFIAWMDDVKLVLDGFVIRQVWRKSNEMVT